MTQLYPRPLFFEISETPLLASSKTNSILERALKPALTFRFVVKCAFGCISSFAILHHAPSDEIGESRLFLFFCILTE